MAPVYQRVGRGSTAAALGEAGFYEVEAGPGPDFDVVLLVRLKHFAVGIDLDCEPAHGDLLERQCALHRRAGCKTALKSQPGLDPRVVGDNHLEGFLYVDLAL